MAARHLAFRCLDKEHSKTMSSSADFSAIASDLADESTVFLDLDIG